MLFLCPATHNMPQINGQNLSRISFLVPERRSQEGNVEEATQIADPKMPFENDHTFCTTSSYNPLLCYINLYICKSVLLPSPLTEPIDLGLNTEPLKGPWKGYDQLGGSNKGA